MKEEQKRPIEVVIEELVLDGFAPSERFALGDAIAARLTELLRENGSLRNVPRSVDLDHLDAGRVVLPSGAPAASAGNAVALLVAGSLGLMEVRTSNRQEVGSQKNNGGVHSLLEKPVRERSRR